MKLLWFLATSDSAILSQVQDKTEKIWHSIIGTFVLITGIFAFITGSFTMNLIVSPAEASEFDLSYWVIPLTAGLIWGLLIITIDRLLIASIASERKHKFKGEILTELGNQKESKNSTIKGFFTQKMKAALFILLRLSIALLISLIITKPFELWLFKDQIEKEAITLAAEELKKSQEGLIETSQLAYLVEALAKDSLKKVAVTLQFEKAASIQNYKKARDKQLQRIAANNRAITRIRRMENPTYFKLDSTQSPPKKILNNKGLSQILVYQNGSKEARKDTARLRKQLLASGIKESEIHQVNYEEVQEELLKLNDAISSYEKQKIQEMRDINEASDQHKVTIDKSLDDLFGQLDSLDAYIYHSDHPKRKYTSWFILFIFLSIETLPILSKMLSSSGEYDQRLMSRYADTLQELQDRGKLRETSHVELTQKIAGLETKIKELAEERFSIHSFMEEFDKQVV